jgi:2-dehydro-3-deoxygalactonokinase
VLSSQITDIVGINWGSTSFRAYRISREGFQVDELEGPSGVAALDRAGIVSLVEELSNRWPDSGRWIASGMIGSDIGWTSVPYVEAPASIDEIAAASLGVTIAGRSIEIAPGIACTRAFDGLPDVMRGEEIELSGVIATGHVRGIIALPGTHSKWVRVEQGRIIDFVTSMSGEIFDRLTARGLLASIVDGEAEPGEAFGRGVNAGRARRFGLGSLLFGARAQVLRGCLTRGEAASYLRGLLIGSEIADAEAFIPELRQASVPLVGTPKVSELYAAALEHAGYSAAPTASRTACLKGFVALAEALTRDG